MDCLTEQCLGSVKPNSKSPYCAKCRSRRFRSKHRVKALYADIRQNAKRRGIGFFITIDEWIIFCAETNYHNLVGNEAESMTVDRIKAWLPYTVDNIQMITRRENSIKVRQDNRDKITHYPKKHWPGVPF